MNKWQIKLYELLDHVEYEDSCGLLLYETGYYITRKNQRSKGHHYLASKDGNIVWCIDFRRDPIGDERNDKNVIALRRRVKNPKMIEAIKAIILREIL